jgi:hypothetical protein
MARSVRMLAPTAHFQLIDIVGSMEAAYKNLKSAQALSREQGPYLVKLFRCYSDPGLTCAPMHADPLLKLACCYSRSCFDRGCAA